MTLEAGSKLAHYEILEPIGKGGMGEVFRARDTKLGREVAIKVLPEEFAQDEERLARFEREAKLLASLNHPNIASIHGFEDSDGVKALVLELVEGPTLAERIAEGPIPVDEAIAIAKQIAEALEAGHEAGVIHRDLKPANVKVREDGTVKVLDYGLAKALEGDAPSDADSELSQSPTLTRQGTQIGVILGTAAYMSPEQARGKAVDRRTDIWAFGAVLFEMLAGAKPFPGDDISQTLARVIDREPDWNALPATVSPSLATFLRRCIQKDPRQRVQAIGDVRLAMDGAFDAPSEASDPAPLAPLALWQRPAGLVVVALAAFGVGVATWRVQAPRPEPAQLIQTTIQPPEGTEFNEIALSPDGTHLAFTDYRVEELRQLWVRPMDALGAVPLTGTGGAIFPFWSPDGRSLGFFADGELKIVSAAGGAPRTLTAALNPTGGTWNDAGVILFGSEPGLSRVDAVGGELTAVTMRQGGNLHSRPAFLPEGRHFIFWIFGPSSTVFLGDLETGDVRELIGEAHNATYAPPGFLLYMASGEGLFAQRFDASRLELLDEPRSLIPQVNNGAGNARYAVSSTGLLAYIPWEQTEDRMVWKDREGVDPRSNAIPDDAHGWMYSLSPSGRSLALGGYGLRLLDLDRNLVQLLPVAKDYGPIMWHPTWSPDGSRIAYGAADSRNAFEIRIFTTKTGNDESLVSWEAGFIERLEWSPDGATLLVEASDPEVGPRLRLWSVGVDDGSVSPWLAANGDVSDGRFSPQGGWIAYSSNETSERQVYVRHFAQEGAVVRVSTAGGRRPRWRGDGRELFYIALDGDLMAVDVDGTEELTFSSPRRLFHMTDRYHGEATTYDVTPDGQRFLVQRFSLRSLQLVQQWPELLRE